MTNWRIQKIKKYRKFTKNNLSGISYSSKKRSGYELSEDYKQGKRYSIYYPKKSHHSSQSTKTLKEAESIRKRMNEWTK